MLSNTEVPDKLRHLVQVLRRGGGRPAPRLLSRHGNRESGNTGIHHRPAAHHRSAGHP
ncbi:hypothetical protein [Escherichia coli]|uniref:hypothetical protein n=1 Tax=Escherichia coli TaxID=562 RepID=UPI001FCBEA29|nr:hypothetical protein [Escherichia coli]